MGEGVVHEARPIPEPRANGLLDPDTTTLLAQVVADGVGADHDFLGSDTPSANAGEQHLADDALEHRGKLGSGLRLGALWVGAHETVDGGGSILGVGGRQHQVTGLRCGDGHLNCLKITHLANEDDVGVLAQRSTQRGVIIGEVLSLLALLDGAHRVLRVVELLGILQGDDLGGGVASDVVDEGGEGSRLAGPGGAGDEHEASPEPSETADGWGERQIVVGGNGGWQGAQHQGEAH